jgi:ubiquinone/menaquinone biosynthesis C-methylase UbiE
MNIRTGKSASRSSHGASNFAFWTISLMHDNPLLPIFRNPYKLLEASGLKKGQRILEVGCGPGYFTIPAAKIVGHEGFVYAVDVHPRAIERVQRKIEKEGISNVMPILTNASGTGLPDHSIDLAFVFGLRYIAGGLENLVAELHRVLNNGGILSFEKTRGSEKEIITEVSRLGLTNFSKKGRILSFSNETQ